MEYFLRFHSIRRPFVVDADVEDAIQIDAVAKR
jgi:hypothetical protein